MKNSWFTESSSLWPGQSLSLEIDHVLHRESSSFQDILLFKSTHHGNVLVLDNVIQLSEFDEFSYQELIAHLPLAAHPDPKQVLVIGGGDGGVLREVLKHPSVESATLVEIDEAVPRLSKQFLPSMSCSFNDPKVNLIIADGVQFLKDRDSSSGYDVIITDSSDPIGPAGVLFNDNFYSLMKKNLNPGGIICCQGTFTSIQNDYIIHAPRLNLLICDDYDSITYDYFAFLSSFRISLTLGECQWLHMDILKPLVKSLKQLFKNVSYAWGSVPTYPCGNMGFILCTDSDTDLTISKRDVDDCKYYSSEIHSAAFVLPRFTKKALFEE